MDLERDKKRLLEKLRRELHDDDIVDAMDKVPREDFVPAGLRHLAYSDIPLPIGYGQTVSQPYMIATMLSVLRLRGNESILELGTGSGYQAAILAELVPNGKVLSVEVVPELENHARERLTSLGYSNLEVAPASGELGCPEKAPFDAIVVSAGAPKLPQSLIAQLAVGGRMAIPIGNLDGQNLMKVDRTGEGYNVRVLGACRFVPLVGDEAWDPNRLNVRRQDHG